MTMEEILISGLAELGVPATAAQLSQLRAYYTLLSERSKVMNLTAIEGEEATARLHFLDSAAPRRPLSYASAARSTGRASAPAWNASCAAMTAAHSSLPFRFISPPPLPIDTIYLMARRRGI